MKRNLKNLETLQSLGGDWFLTHTVKFAQEHSCQNVVGILFIFLQHIAYAVIEEIKVTSPENPPPFELADIIGHDQPPDQPQVQPQFQPPATVTPPQGEELLFLAMKMCQGVQVTNNLVIGVISCDQM